MAKKVRVKKLWQGKYVSVKDYEIKEAISKGGMHISHDGKFMSLSVDQLSQLKPNSKVFQSKFKGSYQLVDIPWEPATTDPRQGSLQL